MRTRWGRMARMDTVGPSDRIYAKRASLRLLEVRRPEPMLTGSPRADPIARLM